MNKKNIQIIIAIVVIIIVFFVFKIFFVDKAPANTSLTAEQATVDTSLTDKATLALFDRLNLVALDDTIFSDKVFKSLVSSDRELELQVSGRGNPFLPIGVSGSNILVPKSTSTVIR